MDRILTPVIENDDGHKHEGDIGNKSILTFEEARAMLGISKSQLYRLTSNRLIPFYKPSGKLLYFKRSDLEEWVEDSKIKSITEQEMDACNYLINKKQYV